MADTKNPPKSIKILLTLYELGGKAGHNNLYINFKKRFPNEYINPKLLTAHLHFLFERQKIRKEIVYSKGKWKPDYPQTYSVDAVKGIWALKKWEMI